MHPHSHRHIRTKGNYGGVAIGVTKHLQSQPLPWDKRQGQAWKAPHAFIQGTQLSLGGLDVLLFGAYHRGGIDTVVLKAIRTATQGGDLLFIAVAEWSGTPAQLRETGWPNLLQAVVVDSPWMRLLTGTRNVG